MLEQDLSRILLLIKQQYHLQLELESIGVTFHHRETNHAPGHAKECFYDHR